MKAYRIKKRERRYPVFIQEIRAYLPKPKLPHIVLFKIHKQEVFIEFIYR